MTDTIFTHDAATTSFDVDVDGITVDDDGVATFDWSEVPVVQLDEPPHAEAFDTDEFYKIEGATVARPIKQPYRAADDIQWYKKPAEELRRMAWSLDNAPFTLGHPETGMVKDVNDIHGFWKNPRYDGDEDRLKAGLYIPTNDADATEFVSENQDVSMGFYNRVYSDYEGDTGDLTDDEVDGFQVDMYGNHVAGVEQGRCSAEDGCGLDADESGVGSVVLKTTEPNMKTMTDGEYKIAPNFDGDFTLDYRDEDNKYFAVSPDENPDDEPKFPVNNCSDVDDAWKLKGQGDIDISEDTLAERIKRRARELDCEVPGTEESEDGACGCTNTAENTNMGDNTDETEETTDGGFDIPDLSIDALASKHDEVRELREAKDEMESAMDELREELDLEEDECPCDHVADVVEAKDEAESRVEDLENELDDYRETEKQEALDDLGEYLDEDAVEEYQDEDLETIREEVDRLETLAEKANFDVKNVEGNTDNSSPSRGSRRFGRGHGSN